MSYEQTHGGSFINKDELKLHWFQDMDEKFPPHKSMGYIQFIHKCTDLYSSLTKLPFLIQGMDKSMV